MQYPFPRKHGHSYSRYAATVEMVATDNLPFHSVDVSELKVVVVDKNTIRDASRFKMTK